MICVGDGHWIVMAECSKRPTANIERERGAEAWNSV